MKGILSTSTLTSTLSIVILAACPGVSLAQQTAHSETPQLRDENQERPAGEHYRQREAETLDEPQTQRPQPARERTSQVESQGSGLAQRPVTMSVTVQIEEVSAPDPLSEREAAQLVGKSALSSRGEEVGEISAIVRSQTDDELHAVVNISGLLGIGEMPVAVPIEPGRIDQDGNLRVRISRDQLAQMQAYDPRKYQ